MTETLAAIFPGLFWLFGSYFAHRFYRISAKHALLALLVGGLSVFPAIFLEQVSVVVCFYNEPFYVMPLLDRVLFFCLMVGPVEEGVKFLALMAVGWWMGGLKDPMDGIVLGIYSALGFALLENISYVRNSSHPMELAFIRGLTAIPLHSLCGGILGFYYGKWSTRPDENPLLPFYALTLTSIFHGWYDVFASYGIIWLGCAPLLITLFIILFPLRKESLWYSPFRYRGKEGSIRPIFCGLCGHVSKVMEGFCSICGSPIYEGKVQCSYCRGLYSPEIEECFRCDKKGKELPA